MKLYLIYIIIATAVLFPLEVCCRKAFSADEKIIFLHHSTGGNLVDEGKVNLWFENYNLNQGTSYQFIARPYPGLNPAPMYNFPFDYWNLWANGACDTSIVGRECLEDLARDYQVIVFKHCYPGSDILPDTGRPEINSDRKSMENYKLQYRALRMVMDSYPKTVFILWTLPPRNRVATTPESAQRAMKFVDWVTSDFLTEDGRKRSNLYVFDFWSLTAEKDSTPEKGQLNCLKWDFERLHGARDSHPNSMANEKIGPLFSQFIIDSISNYKKLVN